MGWDGMGWVGLGWVGCLQSRERGENGLELGTWDDILYRIHANMKEHMILLIPLERALKLNMSKLERPRYTRY